MPLLWFFAGILTALACFVVILQRLRTIPRYSVLPAVSKSVAVGSVFTLAAIFGLYVWLGRGSSPLLLPVAPAAPVSAEVAGSFASAAKLINGATREPTTTASTVVAPVSSAARASMKSGASSMESAVATLAARLAKGGGSADDWELLAKSYEFLGRSADAAAARTRQLPANVALATELGAAGAATIDAAALGTTISGEVSLAPALSGKATAGETLFIVAKSVSSPGAPVAVFRSSVGHWPLKFTLDDSQSMLPGRKLSSAGRVTIEVRISQQGQAMPAAGDLQGATGVINPADHQPLKIVIDRVLT